MLTNQRIAAVRRLLAGALAGVALTGCVTAPAQPVGRYGVGRADEGSQHSLLAGILNALALPLYVPLKIAVCAATIGLAAPATAVAAITDPYGTGWQRQDLAEGFAENCGLP